ncbi:MAG: transglycosylase SLT domain-containing protein [Pseudomonadota bacterium]
MHRLFLGLSLSIAFVLPAIHSSAQTPPTEPEVQVLGCNTDFPCPERLLPVVRGWIRFFTTPDSIALIHDSSIVQRVYSSVKIPSRTDLEKRIQEMERDEDKKKARERWAREKEQLVGNAKKEKWDLLQTTARKLQKGSTTWTNDELEIRKLVRSDNPSFFREAANRIVGREGLLNEFLERLPAWAGDLPMVWDKIDSRNLPCDVTYISLAESVYHLYALSSAGAKGPYQIMPSTARDYGGNRCKGVDECFDPEDASEITLDFLSDSYQLVLEALQSVEEKAGRELAGPFVITAYNAGPGRVSNAIKRIHSTDFVDVLWTYIDPYWGIAVQNYYATFLAARHVALSLDLPAAAPFTAGKERFRLEKAVSAARVASLLGIGLDLLHEMNPGMRIPGTKEKWTTILPKNYNLRIPALDEAARKTFLAELQKPVKARKKPPARLYTVAVGDTLSSIASKHQISIDELLAANQNLHLDKPVRVRQKLVIPKAN